MVKLWMKENDALPKPRSLVISVFSLLVVPSLAYAHTWPMIFASTPATPPKGWLWVLPAFLIASIVWDWIILKKSVDGREFLSLEAMNFVCFMAILFFAALILMILYNFFGGFLPGLGPPFPVFYGMPRAEAGGMFAVVNALVLALFLFMKHRLLGKLTAFKKSPRKALMTGTATVYLLLLIPYLSAGAMTHGDSGTSRDCLIQLQDITGLALARYADAHNGRLPESKTLAELNGEIAPYTGWESDPGDIRLPATCPGEEFYSKEARPYVWNSSLAGSELVEKAELLKEPVISCPGGHSPLYFENLIMLRKLIEEEKTER